MARRVGSNTKPEISHRKFWLENLPSDENLLWEGAPCTGPRFTGAGVMMSLAGAVIFAFAIYQVILDPGRYITNRPALSPTDDELFISIAGPYLLFGHMLLDKRKRRKTRYALTDKQAYIAKGWRFSLPKSYVINADSYLAFAKGRCDTVIFHQGAEEVADGLFKEQTGFHHIRDGQRVFDILTDIKQQKHAVEKGDNANKTGLE